MLSGVGSSASWRAAAARRKRKASVAEHFHHRLEDEVVGISEQLPDDVRSQQRISRLFLPRFVGDAVLVELEIALA
jgi:hypothetical protein